jgi:POT family proton-dependent oligopeptide transporter
MSSPALSRSESQRADASLSANDTSGIGGHPRGLTTLFLTEMWERFSYYGMRALLILFMVQAAAEGGLGYDTKKAAAIYGTYTMSVYLLSILGGFIADNFIGAQRAVLCGGVIIACGHFAMACSSQFTFFAGLVLIAIGTGLLKPNISTMVGGLYAISDTRRDAGFSIFYMGINVGAFSSPLITGYLAQSPDWKTRLANWGLNPAHSWHWGFAAAGVGMTIGLVVYLLQREHLAHVGLAPKLEPGESRPWGKLGLVALGSVALIIAMRASDKHPSVVYALFAVQIAAVLFFSFRPDPDSKRLGAILIFFMAAEIFWAIFEQTGSSVSLFADRFTRNEIFGWTFPSSWWQSANPVWVILLAPLFALLWTRLGVRQPSSPLKFVLGLFFVALSFVLMVPAAKLTADGKVGPLWLIALFFLQTVGELLLSPVGLSTMTKLAPPRLVGLVMGIWFLAAALGNKLAGVLAGEFKSDNSAELATFFWHQALWVGAAALVLLALVPWIKKLMGGVK